MFELPPEERGSFMLLKQALVKRYSTKDRAWVKRRRLVARRQGPHELLSDYINDILFGTLHDRCHAKQSPESAHRRGLLP